MDCLLIGSKLSVEKPKKDDQIIADIIMVGRKVVVIARQFVEIQRTIAGCLAEHSEARDSDNVAFSEGQIYAHHKFRKAENE